jgi:hypothetical protein
MSKNYDLHLGKVTWKHLDEIHRFGYSYSTIFTDFIDTCLFSLLSFTDNIQRTGISQLKLDKLTGSYEELTLMSVHGDRF